MTGAERVSEDAVPLPSLLWPDTYPREARGKTHLSPEAAADLDLGPVLSALSGGDAGRQRYAAAILGELCTDADTIHYRQETVANLTDDPALCDALNGFLPQLTTLAENTQRPASRHEWHVTQIVERLFTLSLYAEVVVSLRDIFRMHPPASPALLALRDAVESLAASEGFAALLAELPAMRETLDGLQSVTIGVNLGDDLRPTSATILSFNRERIEGQGGAMGKLLGRGAAERGITPLRGAPGGSLRAFFPLLNVSPQGYESQFVHDLRRLLERILAPVGNTVERYTWVQTRPLAALEAELALLLGAAALWERLRAVGLPVCLPEAQPPENRAVCLDDAYNLSLALRILAAGESGSEIVANTISMGAGAPRIWVLTGPNRGGKTTYIRALGTAQLLFQAGLPVPASRARLSPVDTVYTHFPSAERGVLGEGRLDDEAKRLAAIFRDATPHSLILLNEVLSGTSTIEALALAFDAVRGLRLLGARAVYVTHLHELARAVDEINRESEGDGPAGSLISEMHDAGGGARRRTFRIRPGAPIGISYASDIAEQHGIGYENVRRLLRERGILPDG